MCHVATTYEASPQRIYYGVKSQELLTVQKPFIFYGRHDMSWPPQNPGAADGTDEVNYWRT